MKLPRPLQLAVPLAVLFTTLTLLSAQPASAGTARPEAAPTAVAADLTATVTHSTATATTSALYFKGWCRAGQWVHIDEVLNPLWWISRTYYVYPWVSVDWYWVSVGGPPYWSGHFVGSATIDVPPSFYTEIYFRCSADAPVYST